jgi:hypothetical protein
MMWRWLHYAPSCSTRKSDVYALDTNTSSSSGMMHRRSRRVSSEASGGFGIENCPVRRAPTPQESVHSSSDREQVVAKIGPSLSPVAHSRGAQSGSAKQASASSVSGHAVRMFLILWNAFTEPASESSNSVLSWSCALYFCGLQGIFACGLGRI